MEGQEWQSQYCWLSCDVCALYPSITHGILLPVIKKMLNRYSAYSEEEKTFLMMAIPHNKKILYNHPPPPPP